MGAMGELYHKGNNILHNFTYIHCLASFVFLVQLCNSFNYTKRPTISVSHLYVVELELSIKITAQC